MIAVIAHDWWNIRLPIRMINRSRQSHESVMKTASQGVTLALAVFLVYQVTCQNVNSTADMFLLRQSFHFGIFKEPKPRCGGSLYNGHIITSASCAHRANAEKFVFPFYGGKWDNVNKNPLYHPEYVPVVYDQLAQNDIAVMWHKAIHTEEGWIPFQLYFIVEPLKVDVVDASYAWKHPHLANIIVLEDGEDPRYSVHDLSIFPQSKCEEVFKDRGYNSSLMICGQGTEGALTVCTGSPVFYNYPDDWNHISLVGISIKQDRKSLCVTNEPIVFLLIAPYNAFIKAAAMREKNTSHRTSSQWDMINQQSQESGAFVNSTD